MSHPTYHNSLVHYSLRNMPIIIPTFNNPTYTRNMVEQLRSRDLKNIILIDNASTLPEMQSFLDFAGQHCHVIKLPVNHGPHYTFLKEQEFQSLPNYFCLSDPDLQFHPEMPSSFLGDLAVITETFKVGKAGLALDIGEDEAFRDTKINAHDRTYTIREWESQFWEHKVGEMHGGSAIYRAAIDTTFALYNKKYIDLADFYQACRIAGHYTCKHIPWYVENGLGEAEESVYGALAKWSHYQR